MNIKARKEERRPGGEVVLTGSNPPIIGTDTNIDTDAANRSDYIYSFLPVNKGSCFHTWLYKGRDPAFKYSYSYR